MRDAFPLPPRLQAILHALPLADLVFTPAPVRARRDGWIDKRVLSCRA
jgi:hypothetical protein